MTRWLGAPAIGALLGMLLALGSALGREPAMPAGFELVATGLPRPLQLALDRGTLVVLGPSARGDAAGEVHRLELGTLPVDVSRLPRVRVPFLDGRLATLGSMAVEPASSDLFLGEENGARVYRLDAHERLTPYLDGLRRLPGGSAMAFDAGGRLLLVDHADPLLSPGDDRPPSGLEQFRDEDYRGPLVFRLTLDPTLPLPRHVDRMVPLFPRAWGGRGGGAMLPRLVAVAPVGDDLVRRATSGVVYRWTGRDPLTPLATLPRGQYQRINMAAAPDGSVFISGGFSVGYIFQVKPSGAVTTLPGPIGDPQGLAVGSDGYLYVAESSLHRIIRLHVPR
jgi:hypothetical protein